MLLMGLCIGFGVGYFFSCLVDFFKYRNRKVEGTPSPSHNTKRDAIAAWENHVKFHLKMNGLGCDISKNGMCKHWFVMGYNAATAPVL